jgi:PKD repeat protein
MKRTLILSAALLAAVSLAVALPGAAVASPPSNDEFANATVIDPTALPFTDSVSMDEASVEPGDAHGCPYFGMAGTVWYKITPNAAGVLVVGGNGSSPYQFTAGYSGSSLSDLTLLSCGDWYWGSNDRFTVAAGETYYLQAGVSFAGWGSGGITVNLIRPPSNNDVANAKEINALPFSDTEDTTAGTNESGEPTPSCSYSGLPAASMWYRYTPSQDGWVSATTFGGSLVWAAYTGSPGSLTEKGCHTNYGRLTLAVKGGETYWFQVGGIYGTKGNLTFQLGVAPDPVAGFSPSIGDPSIFDTIQFYNYSSDPGDVGFRAATWDFDDGTASNDYSPTHRYATDGSYTVRMTATTFDGRTASTSQVIVVKTHDVAIAKLTVPQSASAGQTRSIGVGISNKRYAETVQVQLFKSGPNGFEPVGTLQQSVPVRGGGRTTDFNFSYTFTSADKSIGKVTFKAVAGIVGARDALPADNEAVALPTKVG